jgi:hypothetical protein
MKMIDCSNAVTQPDSLNLQDERSTIVGGPHIEERGETMNPFYITLTVHDHILHNCMLDPGASHNLMPKIIMEKMVLEITRPYQDIYSFDARKFKCLGMIKDLVVNLSQSPIKRHYDGCGCGKCTCELCNSFVKISGKQIRWYITNGHDIFHCPSFWWRN